MDAVVQQLPVRKAVFNPESNRQFKTVILYEDAPQGTRAKATLDRLASELDAPEQMECNIWSFDALAHSPSRNTASSDAMQADLVIVSARDSGGLPDCVKNWIWSWLPAREGRSGALAFTFEDCVECERRQRCTPSLVCAALRRAALAARMEFVCVRAEWGQTNDDLLMVQMLERVHRTSSVLEGILNRRGSPPWGLNE
jgi:hypothetical protein